jgi:DNA-binding XRE family transcriptional regulator
VVRQKIGLNQSQIAKALGCHQTDISRIERGVETPDWLLKFAALSTLLHQAGMSWEDVIMSFPESNAAATEKSGEYNVNP